MKRLLFTMVIVSTVTISTLNSCNKDESLVTQSRGTGGSSSLGPITLILGTSGWEAKADGVFVNVFSNIIPSADVKSVNVSVITNGKDIPIDQWTSFMDGQLWATHSQADVAINYRGNLPNPPYLNIKIVIE